MFRQCRRLLSSTATTVKENIGLTGIARNPNARQDLLSRYTAFQHRLTMSTLPADHPYRHTINTYLQQCVGVLRSDNPERLVEETGMQFEELCEEVDAERELMEALEADHLDPSSHEHKSGSSHEHK